MRRIASATVIAMECDRLLPAIGPARRRRYSRPMRMTGPWSDARIAAHLSEAKIPLRLACIDKDGWPLVLSLWFTSMEGAIWCASHSSARVLAMLSDDSRCAFEVAGEKPPYRGVRGQGRATLHPERGAEILSTLLDRYDISREGKLGAWLMSRSAEEVAIRIDATWIGSWDFTERMRGSQS